jgi:hypothetical protein
MEPSGQKKHCLLALENEPSIRHDESNSHFSLFYEGDLSRIKILINFSLIYIYISNIYIFTYETMILRSGSELKFNPNAPLRNNKLSTIKDFRHKTSRATNAKTLLYITMLPQFK